MPTRAEFLERIGREVRKTPGLFRASTAERPSHPQQAAESVRRQLAERWPQALERFRQEFERVAGVFHRAAGPAAVPGIIGEIAREKGARELVSWDPASLGLDLQSSLAGHGLSVLQVPARTPDAAFRWRHRDDAERAPIGVTGADFAVAETGTLVLISGAGRPRSTSLLPATHVALFRAAHLLESLEQVGVMLEALHEEPVRSMSGAMINFITGPSRTADIELTLTRGVHGPKEVHAIFVEEP